MKKQKEKITKKKSIDNNSIGSIRIVRKKTER